MIRCQSVHDLRHCPVDVGSPQTQTQRDQVTRIINSLIHSVRLEEAHRKTLYDTNHRINHTVRDHDNHSNNNPENINGNLMNNNALNGYGNPDTSATVAVKQRSDRLLNVSQAELKVNGPSIKAITHQTEYSRSHTAGNAYGVMNKKQMMDLPSDKEDSGEEELDGHFGAEIVTTDGLCAHLDDLNPMVSTVNPHFGTQSWRYSGIMPCWLPASCC